MSHTKPKILVIHRKSIGLKLENNGPRKLRRSYFKIIALKKLAKTLILYFGWSRKTIFSADPNLSLWVKNDLKVTHRVKLISIRA